MTKRSSHRKRWKRVEAQVAEELSRHFSDVGHSPVERIPILGRTGPDLTYNEVQLIVDVKSRNEVPKSSLAARGQELRMGDMLGFNLSDLLKLDRLSPLTAAPSVLAQRWLAHMHEWKVQNLPTGITCVVLHRPQMPIGDSTVIIYTSERNTLWTRITASSSPATASLAEARNNFRSQLAAAAEANIQQYGDDFTPLERRAVTMVEQMRLLGGFELMTLLERGALMREIEQEGLVSVFPGEYNSLEDICQAIGISKSEYSDTRGLCDVVFPWLEENTERSLQEWWEEIGKSKFRELLPVLRGLIEGESARNHETVNEAIRFQLDNAYGRHPDRSRRGSGRQRSAKKRRSSCAHDVHRETAPCSAAPS